MLELRVGDISTVLEPSTTTSATAAFARVLYSAALGTLFAAYRG